MRAGPFLLYGIFCGTIKNMTGNKAQAVRIYLETDVYSAAQGRVDWVFDNFERVCLSFSGGKDSTVLFHLLAQTARRRGNHSASCLLTGKRST